MKSLKYVVLAMVLALALVVPTGESAAQTSGVWLSAIQVQNLGGSTAAVQIDFYNDDGTMAGSGISDTIGAGASKLFYLPAYGTDQIPDAFRGAAVVSADQPVAAIVNQVTSTSPYFNGSYSGVTTGSPTVYLPAVVRSYYGWDNTIAVQNTSASGVDITIKALAKPVGAGTSVIEHTPPKLITE